MTIPRKYENIVLDLLSRFVPKLSCLPNIINSPTNLPFYYTQNIKELLQNYIRSANFFIKSLNFIGL